MKPFWITFYSYKGGVGRSLALANIAALLVQRGRRVVLIDFDLEAPGLDSFDEFKCVKNKQGVVEYVSRFEQELIAPDIRDFVHPCELDGPLRGKLWIMPAGKKDQHYNASRSNLDWADLYQNHHGEQFVENWKAAIAREFKPDFVLVDSRTGLTDVGGVCTLHLPDLVVMLFGLNEQNVNGIAAVAKTIAESQFRRVPQFHYVASPVPNLPRDKDSPLAKRLTAAASCLGTKIESTIRYQPSAALNEKLFVLDEENESHPLVRDYLDLLENLTLFNRNGIDFLVAQVDDAIKEVDLERANRLLNILSEEFPERAESLLCQARLKLALGEHDAGIELANEALKIDPTFPDAYEWLLTQYRKRQNYNQALGVCNFILTHSKAFPESRLCEIHGERGENAMAAGDFGAAVESFSFTLDHETGAEQVPEQMLVYTFNVAEAQRRLSRTISTECWQKVVSIFDSAGEINASPLSIQANRWQAMHIAFALTGTLSRARGCLNKAGHAAELLGLAEDIFTVKSYNQVSVKDWLQINQEMLTALDRGELWDGMKLPPPQELL